MSIRGVVVDSVLSSIVVAGSGGAGGGVAAKPFRPLPLGLETGHLVQSIHGLPELRYQGWAELEMTVGVTTDGQEATYIATTRVGPSEKDSLQETHSATVRLSN